MVGSCSGAVAGPARDIVGGGGCIVDGHTVVGHCSGAMAGGDCIDGHIVVGSGSGAMGRRDLNIVGCGCRPVKGACEGAAPVFFYQ